MAKNEKLGRLWTDFVGCSVGLGPATVMVEDLNDDVGWSVGCDGQAQPNNNDDDSGP